VWAWGKNQFGELGDEVISKSNDGKVDKQAEIGLSGAREELD
jgi:alpha-tubulin suppressor-like RCC1 family protein